MRCWQLFFQHWMKFGWKHKCYCVRNHREFSYWEAESPVFQEITVIHFRTNNRYSENSATSHCKLNFRVYSHENAFIKRYTRQQSRRVRRWVNAERQWRNSEGFFKPRSSPGGAGGRGRRGWWHSGEWGGVPPKQNETTLIDGPSAYRQHTTHVRLG